MKLRWVVPVVVGVLAFVSGGWMRRPQPALDGAPHQQARLFEEVLGTIARHHVDSASEGRLYRDATLRLIASLDDPYAELLTGDAYRQYREQMAGTRSRRAVTGAVDDSMVHVPAVSDGTMVGDGVGYLAVHSVSDSAAHELADAIGRLRSRGMTSLVLDLRHNPGGLIAEGAAIADLVLDRGDTIAMTRGRTGSHSRVYLDAQRQRWPDLKLAVLVNKGTASSAELISAALQDHDRAAVVGTPTYGKGVVQTTFRMGEDVALKLTTARWYGPSGRSIQRPRGADSVALVTAAVPALRYRSSAGRPLPTGQGVVPDVLVRRPALTDGDKRLILALGSDVGLFRSTLNAYAEAAVRRRPPGDESRVEVDADAREAVRARLRRDGVRIGDKTWAAGTRYLDQEIGAAIARAAFGEAAELRRRLEDDRPLQVALTALRESRSPGDVIVQAMRMGPEVR